MTKIQIAMALFLRCAGVLASFHGMMGFAFKAIANVTLDRGDASLLYLNGQMISAVLYVVYGILLILLAKPLVLLLSKGLKENES
jgi:hypothetical protein